MHSSHWHPIATAPCNQILEVRVLETGVLSTLEFPCSKTNTESWIDADLGNRVMIEPVEWRLWHHKAPQQPHRAEMQLNGRSGIIHTHQFIEPVEAVSIAARIRRWFKIR